MFDIRCPTDEGELAHLPDTAANVAGVYASLRDDIRGGTRHTAGFAHAVRLSHLIDALFSSAQAGRRVEADGWPVR